MSTKAALKAQIADDLGRSDLTTQIGAEIDNAIVHYQTERFYFSETRTRTFATVAAQSNYSSSDDADIPLFLELDAVFLTDSSSRRKELDRGDPVHLHWLLDNSASSGEPYTYAYFNEAFVLYPIPDAAYTITPMGHFELAGPATDEEASNPWMTEAYELIRCRAKKYLHAHIDKDLQAAAVMGEAEQQALSQLRSKTARKIGSGQIERTQF